jgi:ABC-type nitrate/sulfonate/bicarbonate transport system substrate-binding protein
MVVKKSWLLVFLLVSVLALPVRAQEKKPRKVRIGMTAPAMYTLPLMVGRSHGFYRNENLEVELIVMGPGVATQALVAGDLDFATPFFSALRAAMTGLPVRLVGVIMTGTDQVLVVRPEIRKMEELKGKTLGVSALRSTIDLSTRLALKKHGLAPDADVRIVALGGGDTLRLAALQAGKIDGALLAMPHNKTAVKAGFRELVYLKDLIKQPYVALSANTRKMQSDRETIVGTIRGTLGAIRFIQENKGEIVKVMAKEFAMTDPEVAHLVYEDAIKLYADNAIPSDASMMEGIANGKETQGITREVAISEVADWSFAREAARDLKGRK